MHGVTRVAPTARPRTPGVAGLAPRSAASEAYRSQARHYDRRTDAFRRWRELLVEQLPVQRGDTVLDVGCGTGLCMPLLQNKVGPTGAIIGIDASEQMLQVAGERVAAHRWDNVQLIVAPVASAAIADTADAALFCAVTTSCSPAQPWTTSSTIYARERPSPRSAASGRPPGRGHCAPGWPTCTPRSSPTSPASTARGDLLAEVVPDLRIRELACGAGYIAIGHTPRR